VTEATAIDRKQWSRKEIAEKLDEFEQGAMIFVSAIMPQR